MDQIKKPLIISFITNTFLSIFKIVSGMIGNYNALIADGIHSFSDLTTDIVSIFGNKLASKPADKKHPYGHGKVEYLTSIGIGIFILLLGLSIITKAFNNSLVIPNWYIIIISFITIIIKYFLAHYLWVKGSIYNNQILLSNSRESSSDVIGSVVVLFSTIVIHFSDKIAFLKYSDIIATIIVGLFIIKTGISILNENISTILGEQETNEEYISSLKEILLTNQYIKDINSLIVLKYGSYYKIVGEVSMDDNLTLREANNIIKSIEENIKKENFKSKYIIIHTNPVLVDNKSIKC